MIYAWVKSKQNDKATVYGMILHPRVQHIITPCLYILSTTVELK